MTIWKFPIPIQDSFALSMPSGARILHVGTQFGQPHLWACVDSDARKRQYHFYLRGTGHPMGEADPEGHVGSFLMADDSLVFHVFEHVPVN